MWWLPALFIPDPSVLTVNYSLAWTEMRLCLPYVFRRFDMELGAGR